MTLADLPRLLRDARFMRDKSTRDAAKEMGLSPATISRIEREVGTPDLAKLKKVAKWLGLEVALLPAKHGLRSSRLPAPEATK